MRKNTAFSQIVERQGAAAPSSETGKVLVGAVQPIKILEPEILPPEPKTLPMVPAPETPLVMAAVRRILLKASHTYGSGLWWHKEIRWFSHTNGTNCVVYEDNKTAIRYVWTVCPKTFKPKRLGTANE